MEEQLSHYFDGIFDKPITDNSIEKFEYVAVVPSETINKSMNNFTITHRDVDSWSHFAESFLKVTVRLEDASGGVIDGATTDGHCALQNGVTNLFEKVELKFDNVKADTLEYPGFANQMKGLLKYSDDYKRSTGSSAMWYPDTSLGGTETKQYEVSGSDVNTLIVNDEPEYNTGFAVRKANSVSSGNEHKNITLMIPLRDLVPMCENWTSPLRGSRCSLHLIKNAKEKMVHRGPSTSTDIDVNILDLKWFIPLVSPSIEKQLSLEKSFNAGAVIPVTWDKTDTFISSTQKASTNTQTYRVGSMSSKPVRAFVAFQKADRLGAQTENSLIFDHMDLEHIHMRLNSRQFPQEQYEPVFTDGDEDYVREYTSLLTHDKQIFDPQSGSGISYSDYKNLYPIHYFDFSAQDSSLFDRGTTADIEIRWKLRTTPPGDYHLVIVLESEAGVEFHPIAENRVRLVQT